MKRTEIEPGKVYRFDSLGGGQAVMVLRTDAPIKRTSGYSYSYKTTDTGIEIEYLEGGSKGVTTVLKNGTKIIAPWEDWQEARKRERVARRQAEKDKAERDVQLLDWAKDTERRLRALGVEPESQYVYGGFVDVLRDNGWTVSEGGFATRAVESAIPDLSDFLNKGRITITADWLVDILSKVGQ